MLDPASYERLAAEHPLGRVGEISDVVDGILYLEGATLSRARPCISTAAKQPDSDRHRL